MHSDSTDDYCISIDADCKLDLPTDDELLSVYRLLLLNAEHLMPWMDWVDKITFSSQQEVIHAWRNLPQEKGFERVIYLEGKPVGACGLRIKDSDCAEIGYWIGKEHAGQGHMTKIVRFLTDYGFMHYDLHRIEIQCAFGNERSRAIPERLGYTQEATLRERHRLHGVYHDLLIYGMIRKEWDGLRG